MSRFVMVPLGTLFAGAVVTYLVGRMERGASNRVLGALCALTFVGAALATEALTSVSLPAYAAVVGDAPELEATALGVLLGVVATSLGAVVAVYSIRHTDRDAARDIYYPLLIAMVAGVVGIGFAEDLFSLYVFFEVLSVSSYALVAFQSGRATAVEAGFKYLVMNVAGSAFAIFGISLVYAQSTGELSFAALRSPGALSPASASGTLSVALVALVVGFGVKSALVPLHAWVPDAYGEAPAGAGAMLAGVATPAAVVALVRCVAVFPADVPVGLLLLVLGVATMTVGNLLALQQRDLKRLLAYSSIPHVGYVVFGFGVGFHYGFAAAVDGALFHVVATALMKGAAFLGAGAIVYRARASGIDSPANLDALGGVGYRMPVASLAVVVSALALAGVPPLAGFWGKLFIALGGANAAGVVGVALVLALAFNSFLSLGYYLPLIQTLFARETGETDLSAVERAPFSLAAPMLLLTFLVVILGIWPQPGIDLATPAADVLSAAGLEVGR